MIETLLGGLMGGVFRLTPEILKWIDRKGERSHEIVMKDKLLELEKLKLSTASDIIFSKSDTEIQAESIKALQTAVTAQNHTTGVKWADALSSSVRPIITYWFMLLYCFSKIVPLITIDSEVIDWTVILSTIWTDADQALWAGVLNFWFLGRIFEKRPL